MKFLIKSSFLCLVLSVGFTSTRNKTGKHFLKNYHDQINSKSYIQKVYNYYIKDNKSMLNYTRWFFSPFESVNSVGDRSRPPPTYIFQNKQRSQLYRKSSAIYNRIRGVSVDFFNRDDDILDPFSSLHSEEERLVSEKPLQVSQEALFLNIGNVFSQSEAGRTNEKIGTFLYRKLGRSGLVLYLQTFNYKKWNLQNIEDSGVNVIGVLPGKNWQYSTDKILVVTTYWDIQGATVSDNGGGLALMMEAVRVLMLDPGYRPDYSVLFVAFDKRHDGSVGSKRFIDEYLFPHVLHKYKCKIQGVINIGSILKYSNRNNTQIFPSCMNDQNESSKLRWFGNKGDFLALYQKESKTEDIILNTLQKHLRISGVNQQSFSFGHQLSPGIEKCSHIWNNDAGRFWFSDRSDGFPVIHLTDTEAFREASRLIFSSKRLPEEIVTLKHVTEAVIQTIKDLTVVKKSDIYKSKNSPMSNAHFGLYSYIINFISNFKIWQENVDKKLARIEKLQSEKIAESHRQKQNQMTLFQNYETLNTTGAYYVLLGEKPSNIEKLNEVINDFYKEEESTRNMEDLKTDTKRRNSPMIIKLIS